jgi:hypothetical protein
VPALPEFPAVTFRQPHEIAETVTAANLFPREYPGRIPGFNHQNVKSKERTMKTGRDAKYAGMYVSECCHKERHILEGQMLPRCPRCLNLTVWEIQKQGTGDRNEKDHSYPCIV